MSISAFKTHNTESFFAVCLAGSLKFYIDPKLCLHNLSDSQGCHNKLVLES